MAITWELICHHTYAGTPGVVYDRSPLRTSHGTAVNLADGDFLADGAVPGSGSVSFRRSDGVIHIPCTTDVWKSIVGIKGEVTLRRELATQGFILDSNAFQLFVRSGMLNGWFSSAPTQYAQINSAWDAVGQPYLVPAGRWITLGFLHDGFGVLELSVDGQTVARKHGVYHAVNAPGSRGVGIGNALAGGAQIEGEIDEVKIWRLNPRKMEEEFRDRPMDPATAECWRRFQRELIAALGRHPECAKLLSLAIREAIDGMRRRVQAVGPKAQERLTTLQEKYQELWRKGKVGSPAMAQVFEEIIALLRSAGVDFDSDPRLRDLVNSGCLKRIIAELTPMDCDRQAAKLIRSIAASLGLPDSDGKTTA
jgi:hypothetical protein